MRFTSARFVATTLFVLPVSSWFLCGCSAVSSPTTGGKFSAQVLTGNWTFGPTDPPAGTPPFGALTGALSGSGANVTGTFRTVGCVASTQDIHVKGSQTASGMLTLTSIDLANNVMVITVDLGNPVAIAAPFWLGGMTVSGSGPCAYADVAMQVREYLPLTGTYAGTITGSAGATLTAGSTTMPFTLNVTSGCTTGLFGGFLGSS